MLVGSSKCDSWAARGPIECLDHPRIYPLANGCAGLWRHEGERSCWVLTCRLVLLLEVLLLFCSRETSFAPSLQTSHSITSSVFLSVAFIWRVCCKQQLMILLRHRRGAACSPRLPSCRMSAPRSSILSSPKCFGF